MIVDYEGKRYTGNSTEEIVEKIRGHLKIEPTSDWEPVRRIFARMAFRVINLRSAKIILDPQYENDRKGMLAEIAKLDSIIHTVGYFKNPTLLAKLEGKGFLNPLYVLAYGELTGEMRVDQTGDDLRKDIDSAKRDLLQILPFELVSVEQRKA